MCVYVFTAHMGNSEGGRSVASHSETRNPIGQVLVARLAGPQLLGTPVSLAHLALQWQVLTPVSGLMWI